MSYTLIRDCVVVVFYKGKGYRFDALSNFQFSQTFSRSSTPRKTLHSKVGKPLTLSNTRNPGSFNMRILATNSYIEEVFFEIAGWDRLGPYRFRYPTSLNVSPEFCDIFVMHEENVFKLTSCAIQSMDMSLSIDSSLGFNIAFTFSTLERVRDTPLSSGILTQGTAVKPTPLQYYMGNRLYNNVLNVGLSLQQQIQWRNDRSLHDIGSIYSSSRATIAEASFTTSVTTHLTKKINTKDEPVLSDIRIQKSGLGFSLDNVLVIKRITPEDIFQESFDVALTETTKDVIVDYGGLLI